MTPQEVADALPGALDFTTLPPHEGERFMLALNLRKMQLLVLYELTRLKDCAAALTRARDRRTLPPKGDENYAKARFLREAEIEILESRRPLMHLADVPAQPRPRE
jgi:hypothetical protein